MVIGVVGLVSTVVHHRVGGFLVALALVAVGLAVAARGWNLAVSIADRQRDRARTSEVADNS